MHNLELHTAPDIDGAHPGRPRFDVRSFTVTEAISTLFRVQIEALYPSAAVEFDEIVGKEAHFYIALESKNELETSRVWSGLINNMELLRAVPDGEGLSTYSLTLVPQLWLLTQRRNYRVFQYKSEVDIAAELLTEWKIEHEIRLDRAAFKARKYKVQYAETDYEFLYRILADVGVSFFYERQEGALRLILVDGPQRAAPIDGTLHFEDSPMQQGGKRYFTDLHKKQQVRPTRVTLRDRDYRRDANYELQATATVDPEASLELFYYPENFNFVADRDDGASPSADDRGRARTDEREAARIAQIDLDARRNDVMTLRFDSSDVRLGPGVVVKLDAHPSPSVNVPVLVVESRIGGRFDGEIACSVEAVGIKQSYRPTLAPRPRIIGLETATVVGPAGEEIHCDEFGRVRVHFHWDRLSKRNEASSCWIPVSQTWGGTRFGGVQIPRIGQEVLVEFLGGDPDRPLITGRVFTTVNAVPLKLPDEKTQTVLQSNSTGKSGGHNKVLFEDANGKERFDMRAQRDMNVTVLRNECTTVGGVETHKVTKSRTTTIGTTDTTTVTGDITIESKEANIYQEAKTSFFIDATDQDVNVYAGNKISAFAEKSSIYEAGESLILCVGDNVAITMCKFGIIIDGPNVLINPSSAEAEAFLRSGKTPADLAAEKKAEAERKEKEQADIENSKRTGETIPGQREFEMEKSSMDPKERRLAEKDLQIQQ